MFCERSERDVLELRGLLDEDLGHRVRVALELGRGRRRVLDQRETALRLRDHEQPEEQRAALGRVDDLNGERLLELHALGHHDQEAVLPDRGVVRRELLVGPDQLAEALMVGERLERDPGIGRADDRDPALADHGQPGRVHVQHRLGQTGLGV